MCQVPRSILLKRHNFVFHEVDHCATGEKVLLGRQVFLMNFNMNWYLIFAILPNTSVPMFGMHVRWITVSCASLQSEALLAVSWLSMFEVYNQGTVQFGSPSCTRSARNLEKITCSAYKLRVSFTVMSYVCRAFIPNKLPLLSTVLHNGFRSSRWPLKFTEHDSAWHISRVYRA